ncbi:hypothetical protein BC828DRAFT_404310 [Blastocladiella britannica]|nr:hypothetical protein BC828DRAFT_404310 [Blastocladiella britannica]
MTTAPTTIPGHSGRVKEILCVGVNPSFQTTLHFDSFAPGKVNRAFKKSHSIGGKGQNVAIAIEQLGWADKVSVLQFTGGVTGKYIRDALDRKGIAQFNVQVQKPTRTCTTVLDYHTNTSTELIEPSGTVTAEECASLQEAAKYILTAGIVRGIAISGTVPAGVDGSLYDALASLKPTPTARPDQVGSQRCVLLLDAYRGVEATLASGKVDILKINVHEAADLSKLPRGSPIDQIGHAILSLYPIGALALTNGPFSAHLFYRENGAASPISSVEYLIPPLEQVLERAECSYDGLTDAGSIEPIVAFLDTMQHHHLHHPTAPATSSTAAMGGGSTRRLTRTFSQSRRASAAHSPIAGASALTPPTETSAAELATAFAAAMSNNPAPTAAGTTAPLITPSTPSSGIRAKRSPGIARVLEEAMPSSSSPTGSTASLLPDLADGAPAVVPDAALSPPGPPLLVLNPLGAGDTCSGVTLAKYLESGNLVEAFRYGLAAASASCLMTESTAHYEREAMEAVYAMIQVVLT